MTIDEELAAIAAASPMFYTDAEGFPIIPPGLDLSFLQNFGRQNDLVNNEGGCLAVETGDAGLGAGGHSPSSHLTQNGVREESISKNATTQQLLEGTSSHYPSIVGTTEEPIRRSAPACIANRQNDHPSRISTLKYPIDCDSNVETSQYPVHRQSREDTSEYPIHHASVISGSSPTFHSKLTSACGLQPHNRNQDIHRPVNSDLTDHFIISPQCDNEIPFNPISHDSTGFHQDTLGSHCDGTERFLDKGNVVVGENEALSYGPAGPDNSMSINHHLSDYIPESNIQPENDIQEAFYPYEHIDIEEYIFGSDKDTSVENDGVLEVNMVGHYGHPGPHDERDYSTGYTEGNNLSMPDNLTKGTMHHPVANTKGSPVSARYKGDFPDEEQSPRTVSYAEVELIVPVRRKPISRVVALCNTFRILPIIGPDLTVEHCTNPV